MTGPKAEERRCPSGRPKEAVRELKRYAEGARVNAGGTPRATAVGDGATPRAAHTKNKTDREAYNGCCPCGHRHSAVCLCVYVDETMRGDSVVRVKRHNSRSVVIRWSPARW